MLTRGDEESVSREEFDSLTLVDRVAEENVAREDLSIDVSITNVGLILTKLR